MIKGSAELQSINSFQSATFGQLEQIFCLAISSNSSSDTSTKFLVLNDIMPLLPKSLVQDILSCFSVAPRASELKLIFYWAGVQFSKELGLSASGAVGVQKAWSSTLRIIYRDAGSNQWKNYENIPQLVEPTSTNVQLQIDSADREGSKELGEFIRTLVVPLMITKSIAFYFGLKYAEFPGEGYGWGLVVSLGFTAVTFVKFVFDRRSTKRQS